MHIRRPALAALVLDETVSVEAAQSHLKLDLPTEQPNDHAGLVARSAPVRTGPDPDETGPVSGPVGYVGDERKACFDRYRKVVLVLDPNHIATLLRLFPALPTTSDEVSDTIMRPIARSSNCPRDIRDRWPRREPSSRPRQASGTSRLSLGPRATRLMCHSRTGPAEVASPA